jgi:hypothetical protein
VTVIEASSVRLQTMSDGTLRIVCDVEPRHAQSAFKLFGAPGTPMALAGLKSAKADPEPERPKGGALSQWAAMRCQDEAFLLWLATAMPAEWVSATRAHGSRTEAAAHVMRRVCGIESRADIDNDPHAAARFDKYIRGPWQKHCIATGVTA